MEKVEQSKYWKIIFWLVIILQVITMLYWGNRKGGFYWDEFFTLDNAHYSSASTPDRVKLYDAEFMEYDKWFDITELKATLTVTRENSLLKDSFMYNIKKFWTGRAYRDVVLHYVEAVFFPGEINKWSAISINIVLFLINQLVLYQLIKEVTGRKIIALFSITMYGFSGMAISMTIFIRFYMWITTFFTIFVYCHLRIWKEDKLWKNLGYICLLGAALLLCFKEQPVVIFCAAGFVLYFSFILLGSKQYKKFLQYVFLIGGAGIIYMVFFTSYIEEIVKALQGADTGNSATVHYLSRITSLTPEIFIERCRIFIQMIYRYLFGHSIVFVVVVVLLCGSVIYGYLKRRNNQEKEECTIPLFIWSIVGAIVTFSLVSICISLTDSIRYNSFMFPILAGSIITLLYNYGKNVMKEQWISILITALLVGEVFFTLSIPRIDNVYYEDKAEVEKINAVENIDSVVVDYHFDDKVMYECLAFGDENTKVIFKKYENIDFNGLEDTILVWQTVNREFDVENFLINVGYQSVEKIAQTHESKVYLCSKQAK